MGFVIMLKFLLLNMGKALFSFGFSVILTVIWNSLLAQSATEIVRKADDKMQGTSSQGEMIMKIIRPDWQREVRMKSWALGTQYSLILLTYPARDKGTAFLKRNTEMWNWQPSIDRIIKLPPSMMMQSWMGSDFTNDDLVKQSSIVRDYDHQFLEDTLIQGDPVYKIALLPKEDAAVVWGKVILYIRKSDLIQLKIKFFDEDDLLINTMIMSDIKKLGNRIIPTKMVMIPSENPENRTEVIYVTMEFDVPLKEDFFSQQNLKRIR